MNDAGVVRGVQRVEEVDHQSDGALSRNSPVHLQVLFKVFAVQHLHGDKRVAVLGDPTVEDLHDGVVTDGGCRLGLP